MDTEQCKGKKDFLKEGMNLIEPMLHHLKKKKLSFLCGVTGPLAISSVLYHRAGKQSASKDLAKK